MKRNRLIDALNLHVVLAITRSEERCNDAFVEAIFFHRSQALRLCEHLKRTREARIKSGQDTAMYSYVVRTQGDRP